MMTHVLFPRLEKPRAVFLGEFAESGAIQHNNAYRDVQYSTVQYNTGKDICGTVRTSYRTTHMSGGI